MLPSSVTLQVIAAGRAYAVDEAGSGATLVVYEIGRVERYPAAACSCNCPD